LRDEVLYVYHPATLLNRSPNAQIGLHPHRSSQFSVGIM
jgi:hypothetical protein